MSTGVIAQRTPMSLTPEDTHVPCIEVDPILEVEPKKKNQSKRGGAFFDSRLLELIDGWNLIAKELHLPTVKRDPLGKSTVDCWKRLEKDHELREAFEDIPAVRAAVRQAEGAHGKGWFDFGFLFTADKESKQFRVRR